MPSAHPDRPSRDTPSSRPGRFERLRQERAEWWHEVGTELGCSTCRSGPRCDVCLRRQAVTVTPCSGGRVDRSGRDRHTHVCALCVDDAPGRAGDGR